MSDQQPPTASWTPADLAAYLGEAVPRELWHVLAEVRSHSTDAADSNGSNGSGARVRLGLVSLLSSVEVFAPTHSLALPPDFVPFAIDTESDDVIGWLRKRKLDWVGHPPLVLRYSRDAGGYTGLVGLDTVDALLRLAGEVENRCRELGTEVAAVHADSAHAMHADVANVERLVRFCRSTIKRGDTAFGRDPTGRRKPRTFEKWPHESINGIGHEWVETPLLVDDLRIGYEPPRLEIDNPALLRAWRVIHLPPSIAEEWVDDSFRASRKVLLEAEDELPAACREWPIWRVAREPSALDDGEGWIEAAEELAQSHPAAADACLDAALVEAFDADIMRRVAALRESIAREQDWSDVLAVLAAGRVSDTL